MIKTTWVDPATNKEYGYSWGFDVDGEIERRPAIPYHIFARGNNKTMASLKEYFNMIYGTQSIFEITNVIFNNPATIVFWADGTKTVVKCSENDTFDPEKGLAMAIVKRAYGNDNSFHKVFKTWIKEEDKYVYPTIKLEGKLLKEALINTLDRISDSISRK